MNPLGRGITGQRQLPDPTLVAGQELGVLRHARTESGAARPVPTAGCAFGVAELSNPVSGAATRADDVLGFESTGCETSGRRSAGIVAAPSAATCQPSSFSDQAVRSAERRRSPVFWLASTALIEYRQETRGLHIHRLAGTHAVQSTKCRSADRTRCQAGTPEGSHYAGRSRLRGCEVGQKAIRDLEKITKRLGLDRRAAVPGTPDRTSAGE